MEGQLSNKKWIKLLGAEPEDGNGCTDDRRRGMYGRREGLAARTPGEGICMGFQGRYRMLRSPKHSAFMLWYRTVRGT